MSTAQKIESRSVGIRMRSSTGVEMNETGGCKKGKKSKKSKLCFALVALFAVYHFHRRAA
jgi:hypothetical protein